MKTDAQVDDIMRRIPEEWRKRWCGGENGPCACLGCVQIGNRAVISDKITGGRFVGDPEYINEHWLQANHATYAENKITRKEWEAWMARHIPPQAETP